MPCPRDTGCYGYAIQHSNNPECPAWLVMRWGEEIEAVCWAHDDSLAAQLAALSAAYQCLYDLLEMTGASALPAL